MNQIVGDVNPPANRAPISTGLTELLRFRSSIRVRSRDSNSADSGVTEGEYEIAWRDLAHEFVERISMAVGLALSGASCWRLRWRARQQSVTASVFAGEIGSGKLLTTASARIALILDARKTPLSPHAAIPDSQTMPAESQGAVPDDRIALSRSGPDRTKHPRLDFASPCGRGTVLAPEVLRFPEVCNPSCGSRASALVRGLLRAMGS